MLKDELISVFSLFFSRSLFLKHDVAEYSHQMPIFMHRKIHSFKIMMTNNLQDSNGKSIINRYKII